MADFAMGNAGLHGLAGITKLVERRKRRLRLRMQVAMLAAIVVSAASIPFGPRRNLPRVNWQEFSRYESDSEFQNSYRVNRALFHILLLKISGFIESDFIMASRCSPGPIRPEIMLAITLRMCAGGRYQDLRRLYAVSKTSVYATFHKVINAINHVEHIEFPLDSPDKLKSISSGFDVLTDGILRGCVGAVDGYAICVAKSNGNILCEPGCLRRQKRLLFTFFSGRLRFFKEVHLHFDCMCRQHP